METPAARARLERMVAADTSPTLTAGDIDALLALAARPDADGLLVTDEDWTPTYDLESAAAEGWRWKAAKVAADPDFSADGVSVSASKVAETCLAMADKFDPNSGPAAGGLGSTRIASSIGSGLDPRELGIANL